MSIAFSIILIYILYFTGCFPSAPRIPPWAELGAVSVAQKNKRGVKNSSLMV